MVWLLSICRCRDGKFMPLGRPSAYYCCHLSSTVFNDVSILPEKTNKQTNSLIISDVKACNFRDSSIEWLLPTLVAAKRKGAFSKQAFPWYNSILGRVSHMKHGSLNFSFS